MQPTEAINLLEVTLRDLVRSVMGTSWRTDRKIDVELLERRQSAETAKRRGVMLSDDLLAYTELTELTGLINANQAKFVPALGQHNVTKVYFQRLEELRNAVMHSRTLVPFEVDLINGIVGEIRNKATIYRSTKGPDMEYYPTIDLIVDNFGNSTATGYGPMRGVDTGGLRLDVGTTVSFECWATDPQDRLLTWAIFPWPNSANAIEQVGAHVTLSIPITESLVAEERILQVTLRSFR